MYEEEIPAGAPPQQPQQEQPAPPAGPTPDQMQPPQGELNEMQAASPEEQEMFEHFVAKAWDVVYDKTMFAKVLKMLEGGGDPVEGLAQTAVQIIHRVSGAAEKAGQKLPGDVMINAATEVFEDLANLSTKAKIHDFENDPDGLEGAYFRALDTYRVLLQSGKKLDKEAAIADMEKLSRMDADGKLESMLMKLADYDRNSVGQKPEGEEEMPMPEGDMMQGEEDMPRGGLMQGMN